MFSRWVALALCLTVSVAFAQKNDRIELGKFKTGAMVSFVRTAGGEWGIEISGAPRIIQQKPARLEIFQKEGGIRKLEAGYKMVQQENSGIIARAEVAYGDSVVFRVEDHWSMDGATVSVNRKVEVVGSAPGGFNSSITLAVDSSISWPDVNCLTPGALYGDPTNDGDRSPGGTLNYAARRFIMREDMLPAPMFALSFSNGASVTMLDPSPNGESTVEETKLTKDVMTDARFQFGALGHGRMIKALSSLVFSSPVR